MNEYLEKLINQGWMSTHKYMFLEKDAWMPRLHKSKLFKKEDRYRKQRQGIINHIIKITSFLPEDTMFPYRIRVLRENHTQESIKCPVCDNVRKFQRKEDSLFYKTCGSKDLKHKTYTKDIINKEARAGVWALRTPEERAQLALKIKITCYGENYLLLSKEYIEEYFLTKERYLKVQALAKFLNCSEGATYQITREFGVKIAHNKCGFDPSLPAILYYFIDIITGFYKIGVTNRTLKSRFGSKMEFIRVIHIEEFEYGQDAYNKEQYLLNKYKEFQIINENFLDGKTEFFNKDVRQLDN